MSEKVESTEVTPSSYSAELKHDQLIDTAVKFLLNPKVRQTPLSQRKAFLKKKGLSDEDIEIAIQRSGVNMDSQQQSHSHVVIPSPVPPPVPRRQWRDIALTALLAGGVAYGLSTLMNRWIIPYFAERKQQRDVAERSTTQQTNTDQSLQTLQATLSSIQELLAKQERALENVKQEVTALQLQQQGSSGGENYAIHELKSEIVSLKGLMLSRNQFTPPPRLPPINAGRTGIPSWQRDAKPDAISPNQPVAEAANSEEDQTTLRDDTEKEETTEETVTPDNALMNSVGEQPTTEKLPHITETQKEDHN